MRVRLLWLLLAIFLIAALVLALVPVGGLLSVIALIVGTAFAAITVFNTLVQLWDYLRPSHKRSSRPTMPDEKAYLEGRLRAFAEEQKAFVALAGDAVIESRFDAYDSAFTPEKSGERLREYDDIAQAVRDYKQFVIVGDPGAGKSTSLRQMASAVAQARLEAPTRTKGWLNDLYGNDKPPLPLWIFLGDSENPPKAEELLDYWWGKYNLPNNCENALTNFDVWLFVDGLNEMPERGGSPKDRAASLKAFLKSHSDIRAIVTCRLRDYDDALNLHLPVVHVQPLDEDRAGQFVQKRLGNLKLLDEIAQNDALKNIARNPYTLTMLIEVYRDKGQLPADLHDLYRLYIQERYKDYSKRGLIKLNWKRLENRLQRLAFRMIADGKGTAAPTRWAQQQIGLHALHDGISLGY
jgi:hypothetical protein